MEMDADTGQFISLENAREFTSNYKNLPGAGPIWAHGFGKNKLLEVLNQPNAIGARCYYGREQLKDGSFRQQLIVVGVNANNEDLLETGKILDFNAACPPNCPPDGKGL